MGVIIIVFYNFLIRNRYSLDPVDSIPIVHTI
jgi:hypothetical protein